MSNICKLFTQLSNGSDCASAPRPLLLVVAPRTFSSGRLLNRSLGGQRLEPVAVVIGLVTFHRSHSKPRQYHFGLSPIHRPAAKRKSVHRLCYIVMDVTGAKSSLVFPKDKLVAISCRLMYVPTRRNTRLASKALPKPIMNARRVWQCSDTGIPGHLRQIWPHSVCSSPPVSAVCTRNKADG